jgi:D-3-phosphoglycerate dehydrogenase
MTVIAYDLYPNQAAADEIGARFVTLDELLAESDFITLHTALDAGSENMINAGTIARMKQGVRLVNAARGGLIDDVALAEAIKSGHVAGAALDVFTVEPPPADNPLVGLDGVIHTPHLAASTSDAQINVGFDAVHFVIEALTTGNYVNVVNAEVLSL